MCQRMKNSVIIHIRTNIFLFLLSIFLNFIFLFLDDEEAHNCGHMTYHIM